MNLVGLLIIHFFAAELNILFFCVAFAALYSLVSSIEFSILASGIHLPNVF